MLTTNGQEISPKTKQEMSQVDLEYWGLFVRQTILAYSVDYQSERKVLVIVGC